MLHIIFKNIIRQLKSNIIIYIVIFSQVTAIMSIYLVYGIFSNYKEAKQELTIESYTISAGFDGVRMGEVKKCLPEVLKSIEDRLDYFYIMGSCDRIMVNIHNEYSKGAFSFSKTIKDNMKIDQGRLMSDEEINQSANVVAGENIGELGEEISLFGEKYSVIGIVKRPFEEKSEFLEVAFTACPDDVIVYTIILNFKRLPRQSDYLVFKDTLGDVFGDHVQVDDFAVKDEEELISLNSFMIFAAVVGIGIALDTGFLYAYIIHKRKKQAAVLALNGAVKRQLFIINETEIFIVSSFNMIAGFLIFRLLMENYLRNLYHNVTETFSMSVYCKLSVVYMICVMVVTSVITLICSDDNIIKMLRRAT